MLPSFEQEKSNHQTAIETHCTNEMLRELSWEDWQENTINNTRANLETAAQWGEKNPEPIVREVALQLQKQRENKDVRETPLSTFLRHTEYASDTAQARAMDIVVRGLMHEQARGVRKGTEALVEMLRNIECLCAKSRRAVEPLLSQMITAYTVMDKTGRNGKEKQEKRAKDLWDSLHPEHAAAPRQNTGVLLQESTN